ncbi:hypothetical protein FHS18_000160 [Paenibacillus phyllosphaerae]|uniref:ATP-grasp domain-containing protein n=1 Tax=Paenibacillus phyllosphaerae TaxID=274593 RepID=A0A7W5FKP6_9BACL|nr:hypothetical protein [Paenibacillus phyllosphaerae]MBB3108132.1 hypothetical protein [Paenibacillus phyllosphaerae]
MRERTVYGAVFEAEKYWREPNASLLPTLKDRQSERIVSAMDELMFVFCEPDDVLLTRQPFHPILREYLDSIEIRFRGASLELNPDAVPADERHLFAWLAANETVPRLVTSLGGVTRLVPYALLPDCDQAAARYGLELQAPEQEVVARVNSKVYAMELRNRLELPNPAVVARSADELEEAGTAMLEAGPVLIKDPLGVSGKGNLLVESLDRLSRIAQLLKTQEQNKGSATHFIVEPLLEKETDFSIQLEIMQDGTYECLSVNRVVNNGFAYAETVTADARLLEEIRSKGYYDTVSRIASQLHGDRYFGYVSLDSMLLRGGALFPIVEINARMSMSLIKHRLDLYLQKLGTQGNLTFLNTEMPAGGFAAWLAWLEASGLLFDNRTLEGIMPISANTLEANAEEKAPKGRQYIVAVARTAQDRARLVQQLRTLLIERGCRLF